MIPGSIDPSAPPPIDPAGVMAAQAAGAERELGRLDRRMFRMQAADWHTVGDPGEPGLAANWSTVPDPNGVHHPPRFFKDPFGIVHLDGFVELMSGTAGTIFKLPLLFRPAVESVYFMGGNLDEHRIAVIGVSVFSALNGDVRASGGLAVGGQLSLGSIHFRTAPPSVFDIVIPGP